MFIIGGINFLALSVSSLLISIGQPKADTISRSISLVVLLIGFMFSENPIQVIQSLLIASLVYFLGCYGLLIYYFKFNQLKVFFRSLVNIIPFMPSIYIPFLFQEIHISMLSQFLISCLLTLTIYLVISYIFFRYISFSLFRLLIKK